MLTIPSLRPVEVADLPLFFEHQAQPEAIALSMPESAPPDWESFHARWDDILADSGIVCRTILSGGRVAGYVAYFEQMGRPSISYWLDRAFWRQGLGTRAVGLFLSLVPRPVFARVSLENPASLKVLERNGFLVIGHDSYHSAAHGRDTEEAILRLG